MVAELLSMLLQKPASLVESLLAGLDDLSDFDEQAPVGALAFPLFAASCSAGLAAAARGCSIAAAAKALGSIQSRSCLLSQRFFDLWIALIAKGAE